MARTVVENAVPENNRLIDALTPVGIKFDKTSFQMGDMLCEVLVLKKYPSTVGDAWLSKLTRISGVTVCVHAEPASSSILMQELEKQMRINEVQLVDTRTNALALARIEKEMNDIKELRELIEDENLKTVNVLVTCLIRAKTQDQLKTLRTRVQNVAEGSGLLFKAFSMRQNESLLTASPYFQIDPSIKRDAERLMPMTSFSASFPFNSSGINHGKGNFIGKDTSGGIILVDLWRRQGDITNSNFTVLGVPGVGKSTLVKAILTKEYAQGSKIIILDPEREYKDLCKNLGGDRVDIGSGDDGKINPFQIKVLNFNDDEDTTNSFSGGEKNEVRLHFQFLRTFFKLYFKALSPSELDLLEVMTEKMYASKGITYDTDLTQFTPEMYPVFKDLYECVENDMKDSTLSESARVRYENLLLAIRRASIGADANLWNSPTTLSSNSDFIVLDTLSLKNADESLKRAQYFNACTWIWEQASINRDEKVIMVVDEAYLMCDPEVPQTVMFLRDCEKRGRKYNVSVGIITHAVNDFLNERIKEYGQSVLDVPSFKFLMGTDGENLDNTAKLFKLTDKETDLLSKRLRGHALIFAGAKRVHATIEVEPWELELFGKGGGQ